MLILIFFAFLAGIATVLSPCVIPVLPALLSASGGKGKARPFGVILGLVISFIFFTLALTAIIKATGISPNILRYIAIGLIALFGLFMIFPKMGDWFARATSGVAELGQKVQGSSKKAGTGFWSGFILGVALGLVWTPCAGPILAAITTLVATSSVDWAALLITVAYSLGAAIPMFLIIWGGQSAINSSRFLSQHAEMIRKVFGALMIAAALMLAFHVDVVLQQIALKYFPMVTIEDRPIVRQELAKLQTNTSLFGQAIDKGEKVPAPNFVGISSWVNSPPLSVDQLKGKVVLVDFWTYSCINCIRTLPFITKWYDDYKDKGLVIVGVHTPEFAFEKDRDNVVDATKRFHITYPVALDNDYTTWEAYANHYWPAHYLIDQKGVVQEAHFGEGAYVETENAIRHLLGLEPIVAKEPMINMRPITSETYLGNARGVPNNPNIQLSGNWKHEDEKIVAEGDDATLTLHFLATRVYLVLGGASDKPITVALDGQPLPKEFMTRDMSANGSIFVKEPRKYDMVDLKGHYGNHTLTIHFPKGIEAYAFTFGDEPSNPDNSTNNQNVKK